MVATFWRVLLGRKRSFDPRNNQVVAGADACWFSESRFRGFGGMAQFGVIPTWGPHPFHMAKKNERREATSADLGRRGASPNWLPPFSLLWVDKILHHLRNPKKMIPL